MGGEGDGRSGRRRLPGRDAAAAVQQGRRVRVGRSSQGQEGRALRRLFRRVRGRGKRVPVLGAEEAPVQEDCGLRLRPRLHAVRRFWDGPGGRRGHVPQPAAAPVPPGPPLPVRPPEPHVRAEVVRPRRAPVQRAGEIEDRDVRKHSSEKDRTPQKKEKKKKKKSPPKKKKKKKKKKS